MNEPTTPQKPQSIGRKSFVQRHAISIKIVLIAFLILLLLIPMSMIKSLISEREYTAERAINEVQQKWSNSQLIVGPILTIPYIGLNQQGKEIKHYLNYFPEELNISGSLNTQELKRGLYEIVVYDAPLKLSGKFISPDLKSQNIQPGELLLDEATLNLGISDLRGISEQVYIQWGEEQLLFNPGVSPNKIVLSGLSVKPEIMQLLKSATTSIPFSIDLQIKGSESLLFAPLGKTTSINLQSNCTTPSFTGSFLPEKREVNENGFSAQWKVLNLNRNYGQIVTVSSVSENDYYHNHSNFIWHEAVANSVFGTHLLLPVHQYQKSMRSVKYAFLIIILTFVVSFFAEVIQKKHIHPFQYLLIGLALCLFYTLLIAISEHMAFTLAYWIAALLTSILITLYIRGILKIKKTALTIGGLLVCLYTYIFFLIQLETYALLAGSIGLFIILAVIMYLSQKINWNNKGGEV